MTFELKNLDKLKKHFGDTKSMVLSTDAVTDLKALQEPKMSAAMLLQEAILHQIEEQIRNLNAIQERTESKDQEKLKQHTQDYLSVFYGAMLVAQQDISGINRTRARTLSKRLANAIGIDDSVSAEHKPGAFDYARFYLAFNAFLRSQLFINGDVRLGFKEEHLLSLLTKNDQERILKIGYAGERDAQKTIINTLAADGKGVPDVQKYTIKKGKETPVSAITKLKSFAELKVELNNLFVDEYVDKKVATTLELTDRGTQIDFIKKIEELLEESKISDAEKTAVLAGVMHLVRQQIYATYKIFSPEKSLIYRGLGNLLDADKASSADVETLLHAANNFIRYMSINNKPSSEQKDGITKAINSAHPFAKIKDFKLQDVLNLFSDMICSCREDACTQTFSALNKVEQAPTTSWISSIKFPKFSFFAGTSGESTNSTSAQTDSLTLPESEEAGSTSLTK